MLPLLGALAIAAIPPALLRTFVFGNYVINSPSMAPTLQAGDRVLSERLGRQSRPLAVGDIVTFPDPDEPSRTLIKRVVATEGQTVEVVDGRLEVDGAVLDEPYATGVTRPGGLGISLPHPYRVDERHVFVLGDNREHSCDSRRFGAVPADRVGSRGIVVYWPPAHRGTLWS